MLVLALALAAFIQPAAANGTTADDRAVMSAILDGFLRADRDPSIRPGRHRDEQSDARLVRREPGHRTSGVPGSAPECQSSGRSGGHSA